MSYGYFGSMRARPGQRAEVVAILLEGVDGLRTVGCHLYAVGASETDPDLILVSEIWESKGHHDRSLQLPETKEAIARAMPLLTGEFAGQEMTVLGGLGV
ncbi:putative quinol monooxygenase [Micromonospora sp. NPDC048909]|uniref:putative quinol monooxygenase n=1 Tax=Micromonospora sp. NPDC048909 TaxID=3155643 RepID=UPI0033D0E348